MNCLIKVSKKNKFHFIKVYHKSQRINKTSKSTLSLFYFILFKIYFEIKVYNPFYLLFRYIITCYIYKIIYFLIFKF